MHAFPDPGFKDKLLYHDLVVFKKGWKLVLLNGEETPAGTVIAFSAESPPVGWKQCDGRQVGRAEYAALFDAIGTQFGPGDGVFGIKLDL